MSSLSPGARVGSYEVVGALGAGGMGEVFRARDLALERDVALKMLPPAFAADPARRDRFVREARLLASFSHPNIAQIYGVERVDENLAIVMELVDGRTLRDTIRSGSIGRLQARHIARDIALALDAAHEKGVIHRDLKPANVIVAADGTAKVLDFGLAKAVADAAGGEPDTTMGATEPGAVLGTPAYMSPEQARGQPVDRRSDIWSFGCVLFELLSGTPPFGGATLSDTLAAILEREPDWSRLPADTPPSLQRLARRCLEKDRRRRLRDIGDALHDLSTESDVDRRSAGATPGGVQTPWSLHGGRGSTIALAIATVAFATATAWLLFAGRSSPVSQPAGGVVRFELPPPPGTVFGSPLSVIETTTLAMAPDGRALAFVATSPGAASIVWIRRLGDEEARRVTGTEGAISVFWSPDARALGFFADGQLRRIDAAGGTPVKICDVPVNLGVAGTWGANGDILFATVQGDGIRRVPAAGGTPTTLIEGMTATAPRAMWPRFLPDGTRFLYTTIEPNLRSHVRLAHGDGTAVDLVAADSQAQWVDPHWLLYVRESTLLAQRIDLDRRQAVGDPIAVAGPVAYSSATGWSDVSASFDGTLAFQSHVNINRLVWLDGSGRELSTTGSPAGYFTLRLSADGSRLLFSRLRAELGTYDLWIADLARQSETPVTTSPGMETGEVWGPGERSVLFAAARGGPPNLHQKDLVSGEERRLQTASRFQFPNDVHPDGTVVAYQQRTELGSWDLMTMRLDAPDEVAPLLSSPASEYGLRFSPGGELAAFVSDESRRSEVYVAPFPVTGVKTAASVGGGVLPRWRRDGRELYYVSGDRRLMAVPIDVTGTPGRPRELFRVGEVTDYAVAPDGQRFIVVRPLSVAKEQPLTVIVNWPAALGR